jgi:hypothetical protein
MNNQVLAALIRMARAGDQNAAHAVESEIELRGLVFLYGYELIEAISFDGALCHLDGVNYDALFVLLHATAEQRARAALKVLPSGISDMFGGER